MEGGTGQDISVGTPIMVTVEEKDDVPAFADFVVPDEFSAPTTPKEEATISAPSPVTQAAAPASVPQAAPVAIKPISAEVTEPGTSPPPSEPDMEAIVAAVASVLSTGWGEFAKLNSPLLKTLTKQQSAYIEKYGTTGQVPL